MTSDQRSNLKFFFLKWHTVWQNICFWCQEGEIWSGLSFWPLGGHISWPMTSYRISKFKISYLAWCIWKHMFFGSSSWNIELFFLRGHISWPLTSDQRSKLIIPYLARCMSKYVVLGIVVQTWCLFFILASQWSNLMTSGPWSEVKT